MNDNEQTPVEQQETASFLPDQSAISIDLPGEEKQIGLLDGLPKTGLLALVLLLYVPILYFYGWLLPPDIGIDFPSYLQGARVVFLEGRTPFGLHVFDGMAGFGGGKVQPYIYPPPSLLAFWPLALVSPYAARTGFIIASHLSLLGSLWLILFRLTPYATHTYRRSLTLIAVLVYSLCFYPMLDTLGTGQVNFIALLFIALFLAALRKRAAAWQIALPLSIAILLKTYPVLLLIPLACRRKYRAIALTCGFFCVYTVVAYFVLPHDVWRTWLAEVVPLGGYGNDSIPAAFCWNQSINAFVMRLFKENYFSRAPLYYPQLARPVATGLVLLVMGCTFLASLWGRRRADAKLRGDDEMAAYLLMIYLVAPLSWNHHLVYVMPAIVLTISLLVSRTVKGGLAALLAGCVLLLAWRFPVDRLDIVQGWWTLLMSAKLYPVVILWAFYVWRTGWAPASRELVLESAGTREAEMSPALDMLTKQVLLGVFVLLFVPACYYFGWILPLSIGIDYPTYFHAARLTFLQGRSPFGLQAFAGIPGHQSETVQPFLAAPPTLLLYWPLAHVSPVWARVMFLIANEAALAGSVWLTLFRLLPVSRDERVRALSLIFSLVLFLGCDPTLSTLGTGQTSFITQFFVCLALAGMRRGAASWRVALPLTAAILMKTYPALLLIPLFFRRQYRAVAMTLCFLAFACGSSTFLLPAGIWHSWYADMLPLTGYINTKLPLAIAWNQSLNAFVMRLLQENYFSKAPLFFPQLTKPVVWMLVIGFVGVTSYASFRLSKAARGVNTVSDAEWAAFLLMTLLIAPLSWDHQLIYALPAVCVAVSLLCSGSLRRGWTVLIVLAILVTAWKIPFADHSLTTGWWTLLISAKLYPVVLLWAFFVWGMFRTTDVTGST